MIKTKRITKKIQEKVNVEVTCDFCGAKFDKITTECNGFGNILFTFGYGSGFDDDNFELQICDDCFIKNFSGLLKDQLKEKGYKVNILNKILENAKNKKAK